MVPQDCGGDTRPVQKTPADRGRRCKASARGSPGSV